MAASDKQQRVILNISPAAEKEGRCGKFCFLPDGFWPLKTAKMARAKNGRRK